MPFIGRDGTTAFLPTTVNTSSSLTISNEGDLVVDTSTLFVDSSANKVGIGIQTPTLKAHIYSTENADAALIESTQNFATLRFKSATNTSGPTIGIDGSGGLQLDQKDTSKYIAFAIGTEKLRIASSGQIGIGGANYGTAGQVLTSGGASGAVSWTTVSSGYGDSQVDTHLNISSASSGEILSWNGSDYAWISGGGSLSSVVGDTSPQLGGDLQSNGNDIDFADGDKAIFGAGSDLQIYHDGTDSFVDNDEGDLYIRNTGDDIIIRAADDVIIQTQGSEGAIIARGDGEVELYHNGQKRFETEANGAKVTGILDVTSDFKVGAATNILLGGTALPSVTGLLGGSLSGTLSSVTMAYLAAAPSSPVQGQFYFNSLSSKAQIYTGSAFVDLVPSGGGGGGGGGSSTDAQATLRKYTYSVSSTTSSISGAADGVTDAGSFVTGRKYQIKTVGNTDFTAVGASNNNVGTIFTATGAGSGSGDAYDVLVYVTNGSQNVEVYVNGVKAIEGATNDYVATSGTAVNFVVNLGVGDIVDVLVYELLTNDAFVLASGGTFTGNVGINTTSIQNRLHIHSNANEQGILLTQAGNNYSVLYSDANRTGATSHLLAIEGHWNGTPVAEIALQTGNDTTNKDDGQIIFRTSSANNLTNSERMLIDSAGNITLGYAGSSLHFQNGFNNSTARIQNGGGSNSSELKFLVRNAGTESEKMRLTSTAGLAVVTTGSMPANAGNETLYVMGEGHTGHGTANTRSVVSIIGAISSNSAAAGLWIGTRTNENTAVIGTRTASGNLAFETYSGGWGERLRISSAGVVTIGTNGIAAGSNAKLEVKSTTSAINTATIRLNSGGTTSGAINTGATVLFAGSIGTGGERDFASVFGAKENGTNNDLSTYLAFGTRSSAGLTEKMRITSGGNVGINRIDPDQKLNVSGCAEFNAYDSGSGSGGYYTLKGLIIGNLYDAGKSYTGSDDRTACIWQERGLDLDFATHDTLRMKITYDGKVGINDTNPAYSLSIAGTGAVRNEIVCTDNNGAGAGVYLRTMNGGSMVSNATIRTDNAGNFQIFSGTSSDAERLRINTDGFVGINVQTPSDTSIGLAVKNGQAGSDHTMIDIIANTNETSRLTFSDEADFAQGRIQYNHMGNSLGFYTNGNNERLHIKSDGKVGIGVSDPLELLHLESGHTKQILKSTNLNTASSLIFDVSNVNTADYLLGQLAGRWNGNDVAYINFEAGQDTTNKDDGVITFLTSASGSSPGEKLRIHGNGDVRIGASSHGAAKTKLDIIEDQTIPFGVTIAGSTAMFVGVMVRTRYYLEFSCEFYQHSTNTSIALKFSRSSNAPSISIDYFSGGGYQIDHGVIGNAYISFYSASGNTLYTGTNHQSAYGGATPSWSHSGGTSDVIFKLSNIAYSNGSMCHFRINMPRGGINNVTVDRTTP